MKSTIFRYLRFIFLAALFVLSVTVPSSVDNVQAQIGKAGHEIDYYSDATYTNLVGYVIYCKSGQTFRYGRVTDYSQIIPSDC
jgi:hypothetical protein